MLAIEIDVGGTLYMSKGSTVDEQSLGSLSAHVFETRMANGREHFACQDSGWYPDFYTNHL